MPRCAHCNTYTSSFQALRAHIALTRFCREKDEEVFDESDSDIDQQRAADLSADFTQSYSSDNDSPAPVLFDPIDFSIGNDSNDIEGDERNGNRTTTVQSAKRACVEDIEDDKSTDQKSIYTSTDYLYPVPFPGPAGSPLNAEPVLTGFEELHQKRQAEGKDPWFPFRSEKEWELARWLMTSGVSQKKIDEFCKLETIKDDVSPSFHNNRSLLQFVDTLERGPQFHCTPIQVQGDLKDANGQPQTEILELWHRDPVDVVKEIMGNPAFRGHQHYTPIRYFRDESRKNREYSEMWTCNWWWDVQEKLANDHGTIAPVIIASDQTQLSTFSGDKKAWPVYLSIGNIEKSIRRKPSSHAFLLLGYIPTSKLGCFSEKIRSQMGHQLFHDCMKKILEPLERAGHEGVRMTCADGYKRLVFPLLAAYIADYPEQCLVCCCRENSCPKCTVDPKRRGELVFSALRNPETTIGTLHDQSQGLGPTAFREQNLRPINPFWRNLPHCNIFDCMTPDLLHQLHKGLFGDHVSNWSRATISSGKEEIDSRFRTMTPHPTLRQFSKGISQVTQWTGNEYRAMAKVFPSMLAGAADTRVLKAVCAFEDFMYYAHWEVHTDESLRAMDAAWSTFHGQKDIFKELGIREHFNISKLHNVSHYPESIRSRGTTDGFNSESSERLHIDLAKVAYRATNKHNFRSQMTTWLARHEAVQRHNAFLQWVNPDTLRVSESQEEEDGLEEVLGDESNDDDNVDADSEADTQVLITYAKKPAYPRTTLQEIDSVYHCGDWFLWYLRGFLYENSLPSENLDNLIFPVWKNLKISMPIVAELETEKNVDTVYATRAIPNSISAKGVKLAVPARTSTVIVKTGKPQLSKGPHHNLSIARVRLLFKLPPEITFEFSRHLLAFVDWFTPLQKYNDSLGIAESERTRTITEAQSQPASKRKKLRR
ncbi:hypothetical protein K435DRAFT_798739 [Dendrothele bispora CBS 962.96]|uniref:Uncharacterized protein n=1 Tax=Dendrothele bispora (strain CBS 962.96) TaxID=1314807 RepID=A0A4S8LZI2_DENBC|nr:hypothetical protein K435DRAFT_798739 [Dendrothele bispora CBS 962.96]